jgi:alpha-methylacyl-CoA racemase
VNGPLNGVRILEFAGMGPAPFAAMMLADMGAEIVRIDRIDRMSELAASSAYPPNPIHRGRRSIAIDLKNPAAHAALLRMIRSVDGLIEGYRPGTMERLGLGPGVCTEANPRLVYGRMTGWGQDGPYARSAGHDINYIAIAGALEPIGRAGGPPVPPLNLVGDYGGGGMYLAFGMVCALFEAGRSEHGQVIDAAMVDGAASLMTSLRWQAAAGRWTGGRGGNRLDSGAPFYDTYETSDARYIAVGALEPEFLAELCRVLDLVGDVWRRPADPANWPQMKSDLADVFRARSRDEWCVVFDEAGADACFAPVLTMDEAPLDPHNRARGTFVTRDGMTFAAPAPRLSRTPGELGARPATPGEHTDELLRDFGFAAAEIEDLHSAGAVADLANSESP